MPALRRQGLAVVSQRRQDILGSLTRDTPEVGTAIPKMAPSIAIGLREFLQKVDRIGAFRWEQFRVDRLNALLAVNLMPRHLQDGQTGEFGDRSAIALNERHRRGSAPTALVANLSAPKN